MGSTEECRAFAERLNALMEARRYRDSDLARLLWGETTDPNGHRVAKGRARIGGYRAGKNLPLRPTAIKMAAALGVPVGELIPRYGSGRPRSPSELPSTPTVDLSLLRDDPGQARLQVDAVLDAAAAATLAAQIMQMLRKEELKDVDDDPESTPE